MRQEIFGRVTIVYDGRFTLPGYKSSGKKKVKREVFGFLVPVDSVVRFSKACGFVPEVGKFLSVTWQSNGLTEKVRIDEMPVHFGQGVEWVLGCNAVL